VRLRDKLSKLNWTKFRRAALGGVLLQGIVAAILAGVASWILAFGTAQTMFDVFSRYDNTFTLAVCLFGFFLIVIGGGMWLLSGAGVENEETIRDE